MADDDDPLAGLVDSDAPDAEAQRALASFLLGNGVASGRLRDAHAAGSMASLVADSVLWPNATRITLVELSERAGVSEEVARRARRLLGLVDPGEEALCREREVDMIAAFAAGAELFGEERTLQMSRVLGTAAAAIAEAAIALGAEVFGPADSTAVQSDAEIGLQARDRMLAFEGVSDAVDVMLRLHFERAVERLGDAVGVDEQAYAIAFVDLVDSTVMAGELDGRQLAAVLRDFDRLSADAAARHDVRLVKLIGDGAMLAARDVVALTRAVAEIVAAVDRHSVLRAARGGVTLGAVAVHDGDYFGQVVNLAARAASAAGPGEVFLDAEAASHFPAHTEREGKHKLKGFSDPVALFRLSGTP